MTNAQNIIKMIIPQPKFTNKLNLSQSEFKLGYFEIFFTIKLEYFVKNIITKFLLV